MEQEILRKKVCKIRIKLSQRLRIKKRKSLRNVRDTQRKESLIGVETLEKLRETQGRRGSLSPCALTGTPRLPKGEETWELRVQQKPRVLKEEEALARAAPCVL